ncbi:hypothetical protein K502DRAFT_352906 [Neoconidiobolus thromboides FSU 785]|nr:hypothetical protein K502DRAFT_352906 [Neoconidiobolus thromboides FSU 785]
MSTLNDKINYFESKSEFSYQSRIKFHQPYGYNLLNVAVNLGPYKLNTSSLNLEEANFTFSLDFGCMANNTKDSSNANKSMEFSLGGSTGVAFLILLILSIYYKQRTKRNRPFE